MLKAIKGLLSYLFWLIPSAPSSLKPPNNYSTSLLTERGKQLGQNYHTGIWTDTGVLFYNKLQ